MGDAMANKKKSWKDDPLLKAAINKPGFDDDWAYRVHRRMEEIIPMLAKSNVSETWGTYDPSAEPDSRWTGTIRNHGRPEVTHSGRYPGERSVEYSEIKTYLRYGPPLTRVEDDAVQSRYHGKEGDRSLTLIVQKDHPRGPFVRELRNVEAQKEVT